MKDDIRVIFTKEQIKQRVQELGNQISQDFAGQEITVVGLLKGSFIFMADLIREIQSPLRCDFLRVSSYDHCGQSGNIRLEFDLIQPIKNQHVLIVEDILDTGQTLQYILEHLKAKSPKSLSVCCLLDKGLRPELSSQIQYMGFQVPNTFVVGYGLDLDGLYRELAYIGEVNPNKILK